MTPAVRTVVRYGLAVATAASGHIHADLYVHGYRGIHVIGPMFLLQAADSFAVALLLLVTGTAVSLLGAAGLAGGALVGLLLSRTVGVFGFVAHGWQPAPQAALTIVAETLALLLLAYLVVLRGRRTPTEAATAAHRPTARRSRRE